MRAALRNGEIVARSLREQIVAQLERAIITGEFKPGARLVERQLIERFGVSSIPVREALQELELRGLVTRKHNCGCSVTALTTEEIDAIAQLRSVLEPRVVEWAAARMTSATAAELSSQYRNLARAAQANDLSSFFHEDLKLHKMIWHASGNVYAARALESALGALFASGLIRGTARGTLNLKTEAARHKRMLRALCAGDGVAASRILLEIARPFERQLETRTH